MITFGRVVDENTKLKGVIRELDRERKALKAEISRLRNKILRIYQFTAKETKPRGQRGLYVRQTQQPLMLTPKQQEVVEREHQQQRQQQPGEAHPNGKDN